MTDGDPLFPEIGDPIERKRALADSANQTIQLIIEMRGVPFTDLLDQLNYLKRVLQEMNDL